MNSMLWPEISHTVKEIDREINNLPIKMLNPEVLENLRTSVDGFFSQLRDSLNGALGEMKTSLDKTPTVLILSALAAMYDEKIKALISAHAGLLSWNPLSIEHYGSDTAGERFYHYLDKILDDPAMPQVVCEVFLFVLKRGFRGKHDKSRLQIGKYVDLIIERIPKGDDLATQNQTVLRRPLNEPHFGKKQYYFMAFGAVLLVWCGLYFISNQM